MAAGTPIWNAFNAGELSPLLDGRTDQEKYFSGCKVMRNLVPTVQGPAMRRGGTRFLGSVKDNGRAWFVPFEFSTAQSYMLELTEGFLRFWVNRGQLLSGGTPYQLNTPWTAASLITDEGTSAMRTVQSADVMWMVLQDGTVPPYKLSRLGATNWTLQEIVLLNGPFVSVNPLSTITVTATSATGFSNLTASAPLFRASDEGTAFYLEDVNYLDLPTWEPGKTVTIGSIWRYEGNVYQATDVGTTNKSGTFPPVHLEGIAQDGVDAASWTYLHSGYGWGVVTTFTDSTHVTISVQKRLPGGALTGTNRYARAVFNDDDGWPTDVTFFRERLVYVRGRSVYASVVGAYDDFTRKDGPDITKETALILPLTSDRVDSIRWAIGSQRLMLGSSRGELTVQEQTPQQVFAADNATNTPQTEYGSRLLHPLRVGSVVLFVQRSGKKMRELKYDYSVDSYVADELTVLAEHVLNSGVIDMDFAQEPDSLVWCVLGDGSLAALTYNRERGVIAWTPHYVGAEGTTFDAAGSFSNFATVEAVGSIAAPDGRRDDTWLIVRRTINGNTVRYVEVIEDNRLAETLGLPFAFYPDCGISRPGGSPTSTITGLDHLEGCVVQVLADGNPHPDRTVVGGSISLQFPASRVHVGFNSPAVLQTMRLEAGAQAGTTQTVMKSLAEVWLRLFKSLGGKAGPSFDRLDALPFDNPAAPIGSPLELFSGDKQIIWPATYDTDGYVCVVQDQLLPLTLSAIVGRLDVSESG